MAKKLFFLIFLVITPFILRISEAEDLEDCKLKPVELDVIIDWTGNVNAREREIINQMVEKIIASLSDHSSVRVNAMKGVIVTNIVEVNAPYADMGWSSKLYDYGLEHSGDSISLSAVDDELKSQFSINLYRNTAELAIIFVDDLTKAFGSSTMFSKKKAIFVVLGNSVPRDYFSLASNKDHVHLVKEDGNNITGLIQLVINQVSCSSKYVCDKDKYRTERGYKCLSCKIPCGEDLTGGLQSCTNYCPFVRPVKKKKKKEDPSAAEVVLQDNKSIFLFSLLVVACIVIVGLVVLTIVCCIRRAWRKKVMTRGNSEETMRKLPVTDVAIPMGTQEVGEGETRTGPEERGSVDPDLGTETDQHTPFLPQTGTDQNMQLFPGPESIADANHGQPILSNDNMNTSEDPPDGHLGSDLGPRTGFSLTFSKQQELDASIHAFMEPDFQPIR